MTSFQPVNQLQAYTYAVLKQPPSAPAKAALRGVSCCTGLDWNGIFLKQSREDWKQPTNITDAGNIAHMNYSRSGPPE